MRSLACGISPECQAHGRARHKCDSKRHPSHTADGEVRGFETRCDREAQDDPDQSPSQRHKQGLEKELERDVRGPRARRPAQTDFARALR